MFAGSLYPGDTAFVNNVKHEIKDNIIRLRNHPCIALWCGNNEIEVAWNNWGWQKQYGYSSEDSSVIWHDYIHLFQEMIPDQVTLLDGQRNYTSTSPLSNWGTAENFNHSSMHYWGVWHGKEPFENFESNVGRFMVEYGFQSFPNMETIKTFASDSNLYLESETMKNRQKSYIGNGLITQHIEQYFDAPKTFEEFVHLSQETQAKGMGMAIRSHLNKQPHCMGSLFWQLNDCWPGPSWSVIDYYGKHKVAYKTVKKEFTP
jgi:beta-mannosidase